MVYGTTGRGFESLQTHQLTKAIFVSPLTGSITGDAPDSGSGDCRFEPCPVSVVFLDI